MKILNQMTKILFVALFFFLFFPQKIYSYLDPGTGSYIFQIIIAAFVAVSFAVKVYWDKIKSFLGKLFSKNKDKTE